MAILNKVRENISLRSRYRRTLAELHTLSDNEAADLGLMRSDFARIAREAVYGF